MKNSDIHTEDVLLKIETQLKNIDEDDYSHSSKDNNFRKELLWENREERIIREWSVRENNTM